MGEQGSSPSSSMDSSSHPAVSTSSSGTQPWNRDLITDLRLGLSLSNSSLHESSSIARDQLSDWPPIKPHLRSTIAKRESGPRSSTFFIKVYMEGIPIGRKLDLFSHDGYESLIDVLRRMFRIPILFVSMDHQLHAVPGLAQVPSNKIHVLTYEDKEGDWMMVGDVPWELFLTTVKRLKITRADKC